MEACKPRDGSDCSHKLDWRRKAEDYAWGLHVRLSLSSVSYLCAQVSWPSPDLRPTLLLPIALPQPLFDLLGPS